MPAPTRLGFAAAAAALGLLGGFLVVFIALLVKAPYWQRRELRDEVRRLEGEIERLTQPLIEIETGPLKLIPLEGSPISSTTGTV